MRLLSKIKSVLRDSIPMGTRLHEIGDWPRLCLHRLSPVLLAKHRYWSKRGTAPNLKNPELFDEKLLWMMLYWRHPLKTRCGDKYTMRSYVEERGWGHILPGLLGVYGNSREIDFDTLPEEFVLKCTHGCKFNIICKNKASLDRSEVRRTLDAWMSTDISRIAGELHYAAMKPRIICERFLDDLSGALPSDYKVYCFGGKAYCTLVCQERGTRKQPLFDTYDREWKTKLPCRKSSLLAERHVPQPEAYDEMIGAAEALSKPFPFVRMDFYSIKGRAVLGEMTFTPSACCEPDYTNREQQEMGALITLPPRVPSFWGWPWLCR